VIAVSNPTASVHLRQPSLAVIRNGVPHRTEETFAGLVLAADGVELEQRRKQLSSRYTSGSKAPES
jgi:hypothetical protein